MLGHAPSDWQTKRLGQLFRERREKVSDKDYPPLSVTKLGILPQLDTAAKTDDGDNRKGVRAGDFVINSRSDRKGSGGLSDRDGSVSLINIVLEPRDVEPRFAHHLLRSPAFQEEFYRWGHGIVADLWTTRYSEMKNILLAIPGRETQIAIADFLDRETARIGQLIEKKQRLVELLDERRFSEVTAEVTGRFLDSGHRKPARSSFIGDLPETWADVQLKHLVRPGSSITYGIVQAGPEYDGGIPYIRTGDMKGDELPISGYPHTSPEIEKSYARSRMERGDLVIAIRATVGKCLRLPDELVGANLTQGTAKISPGPRMKRDFMLYAIQSAPSQAFFEQSSKGATFKEITLDRLRRLFLPLPPTEQQLMIIERLRRTEVSFKKLRKATLLSTDRLREYRAALITAAVTGRIDVTTWGKQRQTDRHLDQIQEEMTAASAEPIKV